MCEKDNNKIGTLRLSGDAINDLFFSTKEKIAERTEIRRERNRHINIINTERGFNAEIDDINIKIGRRKNERI